jgi:hypothetical protein
MLGNKTTTLGYSPNIDEPKLMKSAPKMRILAYE